MKKLFTLLSLVAFFLTTQTKAQDLNNTLWEVYEFEGATPVYFYFGDGVLSVSGDNIDYTEVANYGDNNPNFWIHDLSWANGCNPLDTGLYTYEIVNDSLFFSLIVDSCNVRMQAFIESYFVKLPFTLGIDSFNPLEKLDLYPNPANNYFSVRRNNSETIDINILDQAGRVVKTAQSTTEITRILIDDLASGIYFVRICQGKYEEVSKLVVTCR
jgi:hypothetical protein